LLARKDPAAVAAHGGGLQRAQNVGAAAGLGKADRGAQLAFADLEQEALLLRLGAIDADRLAAGEGGQPPAPAQTAKGAGGLAGENHLGVDLAALAAVLLV